MTCSHYFLIINSHRTTPSKRAYRSEEEGFRRDVEALFLLC
nr:MAG TPA: hypothetical protein [Caudoviricetes sp.]